MNIEKAKAKIIKAHQEDWGTANVLVGFCTEHSGRPELVNRVIHTSRIVAIDGNVVETRNTIYEVEWAQSNESDDSAN